MKIPRPDTASAPLHPDHPQAASRRRSGRPATAASLAVAAVLALTVAWVGERPDADAASDGMARAARCDARFDGALGAWTECIARELSTLSRDRVASTGAHFHAWRIAERAARQGTRDAAALRDSHGRHVQDALRDNLTSLHRLCTAAGEDCERVGEALDPSS